MTYKNSDTMAEVTHTDMCVCVSCQFVVRHGYDYAVHAVDPDTLVEWDHIEQVVSVYFHVNEIASLLT